MRSRRTFAVAVTAAVLFAVVAPPISSAGSVASPLRWRTLEAPAPSWYTPQLHAQVLAAGSSGVAIPPTVDIPMSSLVFLGIRPGQLIIIDGGTLCTSNFVFTSGGNFYIGTAGHCGNVGSQVTMLFLPVGLVDIGNIVYSTGDAGIGHDFALISIHPDLNQYVSPSLAYWGGPTGVYTGTGPEVVEHAGWGLVVGTGGTPRAGLGVEWTSNEWIFEGLITPGDSGSGAVVLGGQAAGNITHIAVNGGMIPPVFNAGTSMTKIMQLIGSGYQLATCAHIPWPLAGCP